MSKRYKAVVENGAIRVETPEIEDGTSVEVVVLETKARDEQNSVSVFLKEMEKIAESGRLESLPFDAATIKTHRRSE